MISTLTPENAKAVSLKARQLPPSFGYFLFKTNERICHFNKSPSILRVIC